VKGAEVSLIAQEGGTIATARTEENGTYELGGIPPGTYTLQASCLNYSTFQSSLIQLAPDEEITFDLVLVLNKVLSLEKSVDVDACSTGDIVRYTLTVRNLTDGDVTDVKVFDLLPQGLPSSQGRRQFPAKRANLAGQFGP
jgi:uncharacterized repeat protein (TIGR01451 family)